jgi:hypothetical protein
VQGELALMYGKSRMTISKLLRPEGVAKIKELESTGVRMESRRCKQAQYPELEGRLFEMLGMGCRTVTKAEVMQRAEELAEEMGISDMKVNNNWYTRFIKQRDLSVGPYGTPSRGPSGAGERKRSASALPALSVPSSDDRSGRSTRARLEAAEARLRQEASEALRKYEAAEARLRALAAGRPAAHGAQGL